MNVKQLIVASTAAVAALGASSAFAQGIAQNAWYTDAPASALTRAEVRDQVRTALAQGELRQDGEVTTFRTAASTGSRDRAEVRTEALARNTSELYSPLNIGG